MPDAEAKPALVAESSARAVRRSQPLRQSKYDRQPPAELQLVYDTAPVGLAFLSTDCRYLQINQRLTEICGISVADHVGRSVRDTVPQVAEQVESLVQTIIRTGEPVTGVEVHGQRADKSNADHVWITNWHPLKSAEGDIIGVNVVAEDVTERKRAEAVLVASEKALRESEARFRELADNMSQFAWSADPTGSRYWYNKRWHDYAGTTPEEMHGWGWQKLHHPDHLERVVRVMRQSFETGRPWRDTFPLRGRDGTYRWFLSHAIPIRNEAGDLVRWLGTNTDVTAQIEAEQALRELNETLEQRVETETRERLQIWNVSEDLLAVMDLAGIYLSVNPAWTATLGWPEADLVGKSSEWLLHPDDRAKTAAEICRLAGGRKTLRFESRFRHQDGSYHWLSWKAVPDGSRIYAMGRDITELKEAENELREARRELSHFARRTTLAAMSAAIAHEIKQPLGAIVMNASAGLRWLNAVSPDIGEARTSFENVVADGHRAGEVIQSIRAMFEKGGQAETALDANEMIRETIAIIRGELEAARVQLQLELAPQLTPVSAHKGQLQQVILNLITNAVDAMRAVTNRPRVLNVRSAASGADHLSIAVEDSGPGIDSGHVERIFDAFFTTKSHGMGMGLAICRSIVEAHGGNLSVSAAAPHGSVFRLVLPCGG